MQERKKKRKWIKQFATIALAVCMLAGVMPAGFEIWKPLEAVATAGGVKGNGTGDIWIDVYKDPYTTFKNSDPTWGQYAYGPSGCAWFASARVYQLTNGKAGVVIRGSQNWLNSAAAFGWETGGSNAELRAPAILCFGEVQGWGSHVSILEKIEGNTAYISEGGSGLAPDDNYCIIRTMPLSEVKKSATIPGGCKPFKGCVYLPGASGSTITPATLSCNVGDSVSATKFSWNGGTDCEFYTLRIFREVNGTYTDTNSVWNLKTRSHNVFLPAGNYRAYVDCVIGSNYKASNTVYFTVKGSPADLGQSFDARILQSTSKYPIGVEQENKYDVKLLDSNHYVEEYWHFERQSDGSYVIKSLYNGDVLDCANAGTVNCTNVCTFRWHEHDAQRWYIYNTGDGYYLGPKHAPNLLLDVYSDRNVPGMNVQLYERNDRNKKFIIEKSTVIPIKTLALSNETLGVGDSVTLSARRAPAGANMTELTWSSSNPSVATVDSNGMVKAKKVGTTKITVTSQFDKRISAQATITVVEWKEWEYSKNFDGTITLRKYRGNATEVVIPAAYDGYQVSCVSLSSWDMGVGAFHNNTTIKKVVISEGITKLQMSAFYGCKNLESVTLPDSLEELGSYAFEDCKSLKSIILPKKLKVIGWGAFQGSGIVSIVLPEGITKIDGTFRNADSLQSVTVLGELTYIGRCAFQGCDKLRTISFIKGVQNIGDQAFDNCKNLKSILIPSSVETIGEEAFKNCEKLEGVTVFGNVEQIGEDAFVGCPKNMKLSSTADSALRDYAKINQISYEVITAVKGDTDNNGSVDPNDALAILKYIVHIDQSEFNAAAANCDGEDGVTANDALAILKYTVGLLREFN